MSKSALNNLEPSAPQATAFFNDLNSMAPSGKQGGTPMVSRVGKSTIAHYLCFSNGLPEKPVFPDGYDPRKVPKEVMEDKVR